MKHRLYEVIVMLISFLIFMSSAAKALGIDMLNIKDFLILTAVQMYFVFLMGCSEKKRSGK